MAKEKATADPDAPYRMSGEQLKSSKRHQIISTLSLDIGLNGGIPLGCAVLLFGPPSTGKTTLSLQIASNAQQQYGSKVFLFPCEGRITSSILEQVQGFNLKDFEIVRPPAIFDKNGEVVGYKKWPAEKWWQAIGSCIEENPRSVIIVDSIANMSSEKEISEGVGYQGRGQTQQKESSFTRIYGDSIIANQVVCFFLTQIQANTSGWGKSILPKCGWSIRFQSDLTLYAKKTEEWPEEEGRVRGHDIVIEVDKATFSPPGLTLKVPLRYGFGIDVIRDIMNHAINWGLIKKNGSWYDVPFIEKDGKLEYAEMSSDKDIPYVKVQGENKAWKWLHGHPEETAVIKKLITDKVLL